MKSKNAIFILTNTSYFKETIVFLRVLKQNYPHHPDILLHYSGLDEEQVAVLKDFSRVTLCEIDFDQNHDGPGMHQLHRTLDNRIFYYRFIIWSDRFDEYDKILNLDIDILVLKPLDELFEHDIFLIFEDSFLGKNKVFVDHTNPVLLRLLREDGLAIPETLGNAGVFLIPKKYRSISQYESLCAFSARYREHLLWADQTVINLWLQKNSIPIVEDNRFNYQIKLFQQGRWFNGLKNIYILHFIGFYKTGLLRIMIYMAFVLFKMPFGKKLYLLFLVVFFKIYYLLIWLKGKCK